MKIYIITTINHDDNGFFIVAFKKNIFLLKQQAFEESLRTPNSYVTELTETNSWNCEQIGKLMS